jgi:hypothetical protein
MYPSRNIRATTAASVDALIFVKMCFLKAPAARGILAAEIGDIGELRVTIFHKHGIAATQ